MSSEVIDFVPLVAPGADRDCLHLAKQLFIPVSHGAEFDVGASLHDGLCLRVEHHFAVDTVSHAELLAKNNEHAVGAVSDKH